MNSGIKAVVAKRILVCQYNDDVVSHLRVNGYATVVNEDTDIHTLSKGYVLKNKPVPGVDCSTVRFFKAEQKLLHIAYDGKKERELLISILNNSNVPWELRKISKEMFAADYSEDVLSRWDSVSEVVSCLEDVINKDIKTIFDEEGIEVAIAQFIIDKKVLPAKPTKKNPLVFDIDVTVATRYNGGYMNINPMYNHEKLSSPELDEYMDVLSYSEIASHSGTTIPFSLISMLLAIFGRELDLNIHDKRPMINLLLQDKIRFCTVMDTAFDDNLNEEIKRWFCLPDLSFNKICKHATMFILPHSVDSISS